MAPNFEMHLVVTIQHMDSMRKGGSDVWIGPFSQAAHRIYNVFGHIV